LGFRLIFFCEILALKHLINLNKNTMHSKFMIYTNAVIVIYNLFLTSTFFSAKLYQGKRTKKERS